MELIQIGLIGQQEDILKAAPVLSQTQGIALCGIYVSDQDKPTPELTYFADPESLIQTADALYFTSSTPELFEWVLLAFRNGKHVLIEHISGFSVDELEKLLINQKEAGVKCLIGSLEICHPAYKAFAHERFTPGLIEMHRHQPLQPDEQKNIVLDILMKDLAMIFHLVNSDIRRISANSHKVLHDQTDLLQTRIEFTNGCIAQLNVNCFSGETQCLMTIYGEGKVAQLDFENPKARLGLATSIENKTLLYSELELESSNPFHYQMEHFRDCIQLNTTALITLQEGYQKLDAAYKILKKLNSYNEE